MSEQTRDSESWIYVPELLSRDQVEALDELLALTPPPELSSFLFDGEQSDPVPERPARRSAMSEQTPRSVKGPNRHDIARAQELARGIPRPAMSEQTREPRALVTIYEDALRAIRGPFDAPDIDWRMSVYRSAGGGYEGLQAIAAAALEAGAEISDG